MVSSASEMFSMWNSATNPDTSANTPSTGTAEGDVEADNNNSNPNRIHSRSNSSSTPVTADTFVDDHPDAENIIPEQIINTRRTTSFITLEVYYSRAQRGNRTHRDAHRAAKPYLREAIPVSCISSSPPGDDPVPSFRTFLRQGLFSLRPELKYRDDDVILFQTPKSTNILTLMDQPIDCLPDLLSSTEQFLLKVIIQSTMASSSRSSSSSSKSSSKSNMKYSYTNGSSVDADGLKYNDPNYYVPKWPKTKLEKAVPEDASVHSWDIRKFTLDDWRNPKNRKKLLLILGIVVILLGGGGAALGIVLSQKKSSKDSTGGQGDGPSGPSSSPPPSTPTSAPSISFNTRKYENLKEIILSSSMPDTNFLALPDSPQRLALNWLAFDDGADLGSNICQETDDYNDEYYDYYYENGGGRRHGRELVEPCANADRIVRRYTLAVFYFSMTESDSNEDEQYDDLFREYQDRKLYRHRNGKYMRRRRTNRMEWINHLSFLSAQHECSWQRNETDRNDSIMTQGVICKNEVDGYIVLNESTNQTIGYIGLYIHDNGLSGKIPSSMFHLQHLNHIHISNNQISGKINLDESFSLRHLDVNTNQITGALDFLTNLPNLTVARLDHNMFEGRVPSTLGQNRNLQVLTLHGNRLTGQMPEEICELRENYDLEVLEADCGGGAGGGESPIFECRCCTTCHDPKPK